MLRVDAVRPPRPEAGWRGARGRLADGGMRVVVPLPSGRRAGGRGEGATVAARLG